MGHPPFQKGRRQPRKSTRPAGAGEGVQTGRCDDLEQVGGECARLAGVRGCGMRPWVGARSNRPLSMRRVRTPQCRRSHIGHRLCAVRALGRLGSAKQTAGGVSVSGAAGRRGARTCKAYTSSAGPRGAVAHRRRAGRGPAQLYNTEYTSIQINGLCLKFVSIMRIARHARATAACAHLPYRRP